MLEERAMTHGAIHAFLADDHARLDALLSRAVADADNVDRDAYAEFRAGLLRHIAMERDKAIQEEQAAQQPVAQIEGPQAAAE